MTSLKLASTFALAVGAFCAGGIAVHAQGAAPAQAASQAASQQAASSADANAAAEGLFGGWDGEWHHVTAEIDQLADAFPQEKYSWRPGPGVRSTSEVLMHIARANYLMIEWAGQGKMPEALRPPTTEKTITAKADVVSWLKQSQAAAEKAHAAAMPELAKKIDVQDWHTTVGDVYLRMIVHNNEHMGQLTAYARVNNIVPPWSR